MAAVDLDADDVVSIEITVDSRDIVFDDVKIVSVEFIVSLFDIVELAGSYNEWLVAGTGSVDKISAEVDLDDCGTVCV